MSEQVGKILKKIVIKYLNINKLNINDYRQIAIIISRRYCREDRFEEEKSKLEESEGGLGRG
jgi:hypothetical protein